MNKVLLLIAIFFVSIITNAEAKQQLPRDMNDAADIRSSIERQMQDAAVMASTVTRGNIAGDIAPASTPEKEIERRRRLINGAHSDFMKLKADMSAAGPKSNYSPSVQGSNKKEGGIASANNDKANAELAAAAEAIRDAAEPPKAIAVEGRVIIEGGEADKRAPNNQDAGVKYSIEERFVGNLIIAPPETPEQPTLEEAIAAGALKPDGVASASGGNKPSAESSAKSAKNAGGILAPDYQLDTISTGVKVLSLGGGACVRSNRGGDDECTEKDPFVTSKIDKENKYGNFNDGVVAAQREGDTVKIEIASPAVSFATAMKTKTAEVGCSSAVFEIKASEFKQMIENGGMTISRSFSETTQSASSCRHGSKITLHMTVKNK